MFCSSCGSKNSDSAKFCHSCGSKLERPDNKEKIFNNLNQVNLNSNQESSVNKKILTDNQNPSLSSKIDLEKEFIFKSFKAGGASRFSRLTQVICNKDFIKITRNYRSFLKKKPNEVINTLEVKSVTYKLNISLISIILIIFVCITALTYIGFIYAILVLIIGTVFSMQTKISIVTENKKHIIFCGTFGGRRYAREFTDFINSKLDLKIPNKI